MVLRILFAAALATGGVTVYPEVASAQKYVAVHGDKSRVGTPATRPRGKYEAGFGAERGYRPARLRAHGRKRHAGKRPRKGVYVSYGRHVGRPAHRKGGKFSRRHSLIVFAAPEQHLYPPYYRSYRPFPRQVGLAGRVHGGPTVRQGSTWRGTVKGGLTVRQGSRLGGSIAKGRTAGRGSPWAGHLKGGSTVRRGSRWASHRPNWRFSGYRAPVRPRGLAYYRAAPKRSLSPGRRSVHKPSRGKGRRYVRSRHGSRHR